MRYYISMVLAVVALAWQQGGAQVVNSIGEENMKVEQFLELLQFLVAVSGLFLLGCHISVIC